MMTVALLALAVSGCGGEEKKAPVAAEKAKALTPGEYEIASEVTSLRPADKSTPAISAKVGDKTSYKACVAADGTLDQAMFVDKGDSCTATNSYVRSGRLSLQYQCSRPGKGSLYPNADGNFTADGFEALVNVATSFPGEGDYEITRHLTAKRIGDCPSAKA